MSDALDELIRGACRRIEHADPEQGKRWAASWEYVSGRTDRGDWPTRDAAAAEEDG